MKKIAIEFDQLGRIGGAEKSLLTFLKTIDKSKYEVTLFTKSNISEWVTLPQGIKVIYTDNPSDYLSLKQMFLKFKYIQLVKNIWLRFLIRTHTDNYYKFACSIRCLCSFHEKYDCAIAYKLSFTDMPTILYRIKAPKKCAFLHADVLSDNYLQQSDYYITPSFKKLDKVFCVSEAVKYSFDQRFPNYSSKSMVIHNIIDSAAIIKKSLQPISDMHGKNIIVTVGRLSTEKGQQMIPDVALMLKNSGIEFKWYVVGDGPLRAEIEEKIKQLHIEGNVILLGNRANPYPYINNCTIYVQTSITEAWGLTVQEAKILKKPIVVTPLQAMNEQIMNNENGLIVDNITPESLFVGIKTLIDNPELRQKYIDNLCKENFDYSGELQKLYDFIES